MRNRIKHVQMVFCPASNRAAGLKSSEIPELLQMFRGPEIGAKWNKSGGEYLFPALQSISFMRPAAMVNQTDHRDSL
jgi:hypothetical protein